MKNQIKDLMMFGLGSAVLAREVVEDFVDEMIRTGQAHTDERTKLVTEFSDKAHEFREELEGKIQEMMRQMAHEMKLVTDDQLAELREEVESLKAQVKELESAKKSTKKPTKKKTVSKKSE